MKEVHLSLLTRQKFQGRLSILDSSRYFGELYHDLPKKFSHCGPHFKNTQSQSTNTLRSRLTRHAILQTLNYLKLMMLKTVKS